MDTRSLVDLVNKKLTEVQYSFLNKEKVFEALSKVDRKDFVGEGALDAMILGVDHLIPFLTLHKEIIEEGDKEKVLGKLNENGVNYLNAAALFLNHIRQVIIPLKALAYNDMVIQLGHGQTCSEPSVNCVILDASGLEEGMNILEIGTGSGYLAALAAEMVGERGYVTTMERIPELSSAAHANLRKHFGGNYTRRVCIVKGNGKDGYIPHAPYDRIILTAGVNIGTFDKKPFIEQLKPKANLVYPEQKGHLYSEKYESGVMVDQNTHGQVMFVPLVTD